MKLLENPLIRVVGIMVVLYFALFSNKQNPQSLGNRLSSEKIKKHLSEVEEKGKFIATNVKAARSFNVGSEKPTDKIAEKTISVNDINVGISKKSAICGSEIKIFVSLNSDKAKNLMVKSEEKLLIGSRKNWLLEKNIIGMKKDGIREIKVPKGFVTEDQQLAGFLKDSDSDLTYQIILREISESIAPKSKIHCD